MVRRPARDGRARAWLTYRPTTCDYALPLPGGGAERGADRPRRPRLRAARVLRVRHRHPAHRRPRRRRPPLQPLPRDRALLADARVPADRAQPPRGRHGVPHRHADGASPATPGAVPRSAAPLPRVLRDAGYNTLARRQVAPRPRRRAIGSRARSTAGRSGSASSATTGSSRATPTTGRRTSCATTTTSSRPRRRDDGYHLTEDLADEAIRADHRGSSRPRPTARSSSTSRLGAMHAPHHVAPEWVEPYRGRFDGGWEPWRARRVRAPARDRRRARGHRALRPARAGSQEWDVAARADDAAHASRASTEVFAGFLTAHRRADRAGCRRSSNALGVLDNTLVMLDLRQRRQRRGRHASARSTSTASPSTSPTPSPATSP